MADTQTVFADSRLDKPGRPLRRDAAENRIRVLAAAERVFALRGLDASVDEVAKEAGVGMGTLYRRFPSKQALIDELVGALRRDLRDLARRAGALPDDVALETLMFGAGEVQLQSSACLRQLWLHSDAEIEAVQEFRTICSKLLIRAQARNLIRPEITPTDVSLALRSVADVIATTGSVAPGAWRRHLELLFAGFRPPAGNAAPLVYPPVSDAELQSLTNAER